MGEEAIEQDYNEYMVLQPDASVRDYMWSLFNRIVLKGSDSSTYSEMGRFVAMYEGKNGNRYHRIRLNEEFKRLKDEYNYREKGFKWGFYLIGNERCPHSMKYDGDHDFNEFPNVVPLAGDDCTLLSCTCCLGAVALRDASGRLIRTEN